MQPQNSGDPKSQIRAEELNADVQALLAGPEAAVDQAVGTLRQVMALLDGDPSQRAGEIRQRAGELWGLLCEKEENLDNTQALLDEGEQLFPGLPAAQRLAEMLELVELGLGVRRAIDLGPDRRWPAWLEQPDAVEHLQNLMGAFEVLDGPRAWPAIRRQIGQYRQAFVGDMYGPYLEVQYQEARREARQRNFARALQTIETSIQLVSEQAPTELPANIDQGEMLLLKDALAARQQSEVALWSAAVRLTSSDVPFGEVLPEITLDPVDHPDVPMDDLAALMDDLTKVEKVETVYLELSNPERFAEGVYHSQNLGQVRLAIESDLPAFLKGNDSLLTKKLAERMIGVLKRIDHAYDAIAVKLAQQIETEIQFHELDFNPAHLLDSYWQLSWCLASGLINDPSVAEDLQLTLTKTQEGLSVLAKRAAQVFQNMMADADLVYVDRVLGTLRVLNTGLVQFPESGDGDQYLVKLPPLPEGTQFQKITPKFDDWALEEWSVMINSWQARVNKGSFLQQVDIHDVSGLESVAEFMQGFLDDLHRLKSYIWPAFEMPLWQEDSSPGRLEGEARLQLYYTSILQESLRMWQEESAIDVLVYLDEQLVQAGLVEGLEEYTLWLLETPRIYLKNKYENLSPIVIDGVYSQVGDLLEDPSRSARQLRSEILTRPRSVESGEVLYRAIYSITDQLVGAALKSGQREDAISLWAIVFEATQPWAGGRVQDKDYPKPGQDVGLLWGKLHRAAWIARFKVVVMNRKREIAASLAILVVLLVILIGANVLLRSTGDGDRQSGVIVVPSVTQDNTGTQTQQAMEAGLAASAAIDLTQEGIAQRTNTAQANANTAQAGTQMAATQQAAIAHLETSTAQAIAAATAFHGTAKAQASTATQSALEAMATAEALRCSEVAGYALEISSDLEFEPPLGAEYIIGTTPISSTVTWEVTNVDGCKWEQLDLRPVSGESDVNYSLLREDKITEVSPEEPLDGDDTIKIVLNFDVLNANNIDEEWVLVVNGFALQEQPHLALDVEDWIIIITPPSSRP